MDAKAASSAPPVTRPDADPQAAQTLLVVCLCAQWCGVCREYRSTFDAVAAAHPGVRFEWVDVEDEAEVLDDVDLDNFPTLLIGSGSQPRFFGPVMPQRATLQRLVQAQVEATRSAERDEADLPDGVDTLLGRVRAHLGLR